MNNIFIRLLNRAKLLPLLNLNSQIQVMGKGIKVPVQSSTGFQHLQSFEPWMEQLMTKLKPFFAGHFVDIGVNLGQTLMKAKAVFGNFNYVGFEPNPDCVAYVKELIRLNKWDNCNLVPAGISANQAVIKLNFFSAEKADPSASIVSNFRPNEKVDHYSYITVVNEASVDGLLPQAANCFVKIDVEGAELEVLKGLHNWIGRTRPIFIMEILPVYSADNQFRLKRQNELEEILAQLEYCIFKIQKEQVHLAELKTIGIHGNVNDCDYVLCPVELKDSVMDTVNR